MGNCKAGRAADCWRNRSRHRCDYCRPGAYVRTRARRRDRGYDEPEASLAIHFRQTLEL